MVLQNEAALEKAEDSGEKASIKEADKYCKAIIGRLSRGATFLKGSLPVIALAAGAGFMLSPNLDLTADLEKLQAMAFFLFEAKLGYCSSSKKQGSRSFLSSLINSCLNASPGGGEAGSISSP